MKNIGKYLLISMLPFLSLNKSIAQEGYYKKNPLENKIFGIEHNLNDQLNFGVGIDVKFLQLGKTYFIARQAYYLFAKPILKNEEITLSKVNNNYVLENISNYKKPFGEIGMEIGIENFSIGGGIFSERETKETTKTTYILNEGQLEEEKQKEFLGCSVHPYGNFSFHNDKFSIRIFIYPEPAEKSPTIGIGFINFL